VDHAGSNVLSLARTLLHPHSKLPPLLQESHRDQPHPDGQLLVQGEFGRSDGGAVAGQTRDGHCLPQFGQRRSPPRQNVARSQRMVRHSPDLRQRDDRTPPDADDGPQKRQRIGAAENHHHHTGQDACQDAVIDAIQSAAAAIENDVLDALDAGTFLQSAPHGPRLRRPTHPRPQRRSSQPPSQSLLPDERRRDDQDDDGRRINGGSVTVYSASSHFIAAEQSRPRLHSSSSSSSSSIQRAFVEF